MSHAGQLLKKGISIFNSLEEGKPHSSITDWIEVLSSDRYDELSLDGIPELVESINIQGHVGTTEASRAIRKKLKYGNVHRQLRALVILRSLTENAGKGFQLHWANQELVNRLKEMAQDSLLDPKVKKRLVLVFHAWSLQYKDEPRMQTVARLYSQHMGGPGARKPTAPTSAAPRATTTSSPRASVDAARPAKPQGGFSDYDDLFSHDWQPAAGSRGPDTYADLAAAKADADERKRQRESRIALEQREAELERREREANRKQDMAALEARRQKEALEEQERRRKAKDDAKNRKNQPQKPKFDFQREKPQIMVTVATALQAANNLVNSCRHLNRELENVTESPKVQENLDKAKAARRAVIRYVQLVNDEEYVGTLLDANEKVVEAIQLYDKLSKPAVLDSDSEEDDYVPGKAAGGKEVDNMSKRLAAQKLEADRTGELQQLQARQKRESQRQAQKRAQRSQGAHPDLEDLDFSPIGRQSNQLPSPIRPDDNRNSRGYSSDDYSDNDYNSSDDDWREKHAARSRRQSRAEPSSGRGDRYSSLDDGGHGKKGLLDPNDPFGDPFAGEDDDTPMHEKPRMGWTEI